MKCLFWYLLSGFLCCFPLRAAEDVVVDFSTAKMWVHEAEKRAQSLEAVPAEKCVFRWDARREGYGELFLENPVVLPGDGTGLFQLKYRNLAEPSGLRTLNLRLVDDKGETFQWKQSPTFHDGSVLFDVTPDNFVDCWGGDGRPRPPLRVVGLGLDFAAGSGAGTIEPGMLTFESGRHIRFPVREKWRSFDENELWKLEAYRGNVKTSVVEEGMRVDAAAEIVILRDREVQIEKFGRPREMRFRIRLDSGAAQFAPELRDSARNVRLLPKQELKPGWNELVFPLGELLRECPGQMSVECLKLFLPDGRAEVVLAEAELIRELTPVEAIRFRVETGREELRILDAGTEDEVAVVFTNGFTDRALTFTAELEVEYYYGEKSVQHEELQLAPGESRHIPLQWKRSGFGWYQVHCVLSENSMPEEKRLVSNSFVYLNPAGPTPGRAEGFLFGVCSHPERWGKRARELEIEAAGLCGAKVLRDDTEWYLIQPTPEVWDYSILDHIVDLSTKNGIELNAILAYTPPWARDESQGPRIDPWRVYVRRTVERYRDRIRFWEVWNEPDLPGFAPFGTDHYLEMLKSAHAEIKAAQPDAIVLTGGFATSVVLQQMLADPYRQEKILTQGRGSYQIHAFHGHGHFPYFVQLVDLNLLPMRRKLGVTEPWYANETALTSTEGGERKQTEAVFKKLLYAWSRGSIGYNWYDLRNDGYSDTDGEHNYGMLTFDFQPKPVYAVYNMLAGTFTGAEFLQQEKIEGMEELWLFAFRKDNTLLLPGWIENSDSGNRPVAIRTDARSAERIDLMGNVTPLPVVDGLVVFEFGPEPATLRLIDARRNSIAGCPVQLAEGGPAVPGQEHTVVVMLENPLKTATDFKLELITPPELEMQATNCCALRLEPGEKRQWSLSGVLNGFPDASGEGKARIALRYELAGTSHKWIGEESSVLRTALPVFSERGAEDRQADFRLERSEQLHSFFRNDPAMSHLVWKGLEDLSAEVRLSATEERLNLVVRVRDDVHFQPFRGPDVWLGDCVQIGLAFPGQHGFWEIGLSLLDNGANEVFLWQAAAGFSPAEAAGKIHLNAHREPGAVVYQVQLPYRVFGVTAETLKSGFRFNLVINDNDGGGRESFMRIAPGLAEYKQLDLFPCLMVVE